MTKKKIVFWFVLPIALICVLAAIFFVREKRAVDENAVIFKLHTDSVSEAELSVWRSDYDGELYLFLPSFYSDDCKCVITSDAMHLIEWDGEGLSFFCEPQDLTEGDHELKVAGSVFTVHVMHSENVPSLFLTTASGSLSYIEEKKGNEEDGLYSMIASDGKVISSGQMNGLKSRGNVTFEEDKKPYQMSLTDAVDLFGGKKPIQNYILLANRQDQSLLRDYVMYTIAADAGLPYTPRTQFVDLYINNAYRGSYLLSEKVEVADNRVPIQVSKKETETGFLVALEYEDRLEAEGPHFVTKNGQGFVVKMPKKPTDSQLFYMQSRFEEIEEAAGDDALMQSLSVDWMSFADKYVIEELGKNMDAMYSSQYFYCEAPEAAGGENHESGVIYAGPIWDYDKTLGNPLIEHNRPVNFQEPWGIFAASKQENANWWHNLCKSAYFQGLVRGSLSMHVNPAARLMLDTKLPAVVEDLKASAYMDYMRWDPFEHYKYEEELTFDEDYVREANTIRSFLTQRMEFLEKVYNGAVRYDELTLDPDGGELFVKTMPALEGYAFHEPRDPKKEGYRFAYWVRSDTGEEMNFDEEYDGMPFELKAVYSKE